MTKLTIQLDCKTYRVARKYSPVPLVINTYIESGDLVELQPQEEKTEVIPDIRKNPILQKLRTELESMKTDDTYHTPTLEIVSDVLNELEDKNTITGVLDNTEDLMEHLDSLKEKETQPNSSETPNSSIPDWTPTP